MQIDIHAHSCEAESGVFRLYSKADWRLMPETGFLPQHGMGLSVGVHPWEALSWNETEKEALRAVLTSPDVMMVGEIGLDKICNVPFDIQKSVFLFQLEVAAACGKPVILHVVKAMTELLAIRKTIKNIPAWILHGFRGGPEEAAQYLSAGFYLSFGTHHHRETIQLCPADRLFLETDEKGDIHALFDEVARERGLRLIELESIVERNFRTVFSAASTNLWPLSIAE